MSDSRYDLYEALSQISQRPRPFEAYTAEILWDDEHISKQMLSYHLDGKSEPATRPLEFVERSAAWIANRFSLSAGRRVIDFGCGPGIYTSRFAQKGASVMGVDFSRRSIAHARSDAQELHLDVEYVLANYLNFNTDRQFDLATLIYCDLCALSPTQRTALLQTIHETLTKDGALLLDVFSEQAYQGRTEATQLERRLMDGFWASGDYWGISNTFKYNESKIVLDKYAIIEPSQTRLIYNWLQYFSLNGLTHELEQCGFRVVENCADVAGARYSNSSDTFAVIAQKT